jgi:hypothetical protein
VCQWLTPVILAAQEAEIRRFTVQSQAGQIVRKILAKNPFAKKIGLVEWLKMKALNSRLSTVNK